MPPKVKFTKAAIVEAALTVAREEGIDAVAARTVAQKINATVSPIFTVFGSMEALKDAVTEKAREDWMRELSGAEEYRPSFKEFGLRWIEYAVREPQLYRLLTDRNGGFDRESELGRTLLSAIGTELQLDGPQARELFEQMLIFAHGLSDRLLTEQKRPTREELSQKIGEACLGMVFLLQLRSGSFSMERAKAMAAGAGRMPERI